MDYIHIAKFAIIQNIRLKDLGFWYNEYHDEVGENEVLYEPAEDHWRKELSEISRTQNVIR